VVDKESTPSRPSSPPFRARGGVRIQGRGRYGWTHPGTVNATWPFASLEADRNFIVINSPVGTVRISRENVLLIEACDGWIGKGVRFWSGDDDRDVIFWTRDPELIIDSLRVLGWDAEG
jgi:hypothetical protein